jgi:hypothetical protein
MNNSQSLLNNVLNMLNIAKNPNQIIEELIKRDPQASILLNQMKNSGLSPQNFVKQYAKQNNINLEPILQGLNQNGIKL